MEKIIKTETFESYEVALYQEEEKYIVELRLGNRVLEKSTPINYLENAEALFEEVLESLY